MNLLQLAQRLRLEVGASGTDSTVTSATGEWQRLITWCNAAWEEIQRRHTTWNWMRQSVSFSTIASQGEYAYASAPLSITSFASWDVTRFRVYKTSIGNENFMTFMPYDRFIDTYRIGTTRTAEGYPNVITVSPTNSLLVSLIPADTSYVISGTYYKGVTSLSADTDTPDMPDRFHMAIVYLAMQYYALWESAPEVMVRGKAMFGRMIVQLENDQLQLVTTNRDSF